MNQSRQLAAWVAETPYEALPQDVVELVRTFVLDGLASGFAGARTPWAGMVADMVQEGSTGAASLFGRSWTASLSGAALFNGVCVGGFETDGPYSPGSCHPSAAVLPAALAVAEQQHLSGRELIAAIALGYEGLCRVGAAATRAVEDERGFHGPGTNSAFGGAFGAGSALGFDAATMLHAIGIAGSHGGGLLEFHHEGAMTKRLHIGRGSQMGLEAALLAQKGFTGPSTVLEGEHGFLHVYSPTPKPELLLQDLGEKWLLKGMAFKAHNMASLLRT
jgi:2-methylcitrate dehydratase PrpD